MKILSMTESDDARPYHHGRLRDALLQAAEAELCAVGPDALSLRACARRAGVSHAAPAHHFGSVGGLLAELAAIGFDRLTAAMTLAADSAGTALDSLQATGMAYVRFALAHPALFRLMFRGNHPAGHTRLRMSGQAAFAVLAGRLDDALTGWTVTDLPARRRLAWAAVHGLAMLALDGHVASDDDQDIAAALARLRVALTGP